MPHVIINDRAWAGIERCHAFLFDKAPEAAARAQKIILDKIAILEDRPYHGRPYYPATPNEEGEGLRELVIPFGKGAYLALYRYRKEQDTVDVIAVKHGREARYY